MYVVIAIWMFKMQVYCHWI